MLAAKHGRPNGGDNVARHGEVWWSILDLTEADWWEAASAPKPSFAVTDEE